MYWYDYIPYSSWLAALVWISYFPPFKKRQQLEGSNSYRHLNRGSNSREVTHIGISIHNSNVTEAYLYIISNNVILKCWHSLWYAKTKSYWCTPHIWGISNTYTTRPRWENYVKYKIQLNIQAKSSDYLAAWKTRIIQNC